MVKAPATVRQKDAKEQCLTLHLHPILLLRRSRAWRRVAIRTLKNYLRDISMPIDKKIKRDELVKLWEDNEMLMDWESRV